MYKRKQHFVYPLDHLNYKTKIAYKKRLEGGGKRYRKNLNHLVQNAARKIKQEPVETIQMGTKNPFAVIFLHFKTFFSLVSSINMSNLMGTTPWISYNDYCTLTKYCTQGRA